MKLFKNTEISLKWFGQTRKKLIVEKDTEANLVTNTLNSLYNEAVLNITNSTVMTCEGLVDNKAEPALVEPELSVIWATINKLQDTMLVQLNQVTSAYDIKLSRIEAELNKVRFEYESKIDALNIKYTELWHEQDSKNGFESKLDNVELEVVNLKADVQKLQCENNFLKDILQSDELVWSKPKKMYRSKLAHSQFELSVANSFEFLEVEEARCDDNTAGASADTTNGEQSIVTENVIMNNAAEEISLAEPSLSDDNSIVILTQANSSDVNSNQHGCGGVTGEMPNCHKEQVAEYRNSQEGKLNAREKTLLAGDSMVKHICNQKVSRACRGTAECHSFSGATVSTMETKLNSLMSNESFSNVIIHVGTNDLVHSLVEVVSKDLENLVMKVKNRTNNIAISSVIIGSDGQVDSDKVLLFNRVIKEWCINNDVHFIDNSDINCTHLNGSNLHLNRTGDRLLGRNICAYLRLLRMGYVCCDNLCDKIDDNLCDKTDFQSIPVRITTRRNARYRRSQRIQPKKWVSGNCRQDFRPEAEFNQTDWYQ